jgi:acyl-coenzyme A thioesterase PaaI-like protein
VETDGFATAPATIQSDHVLSRLGMRDVEDSTERLVIEMDDRSDLTNTRGALQGGLVATDHRRTGAGRGHRRAGR